MFAYGQTGSGKTYTMLGELGPNHTLCAQSGLMPRIFDHLLAEKHKRCKVPEAGTTCKIELELSMLEIYNETIMDLLCPANCNLAVREDTVQGVHVESLSRHRIHSGAPDECQKTLLLPSFGCLKVVSLVGFNLQVAVW